MKWFRFPTIPARIFNRVTCSSEEINSLRDYLLKEARPVLWIVKSIDKGAKITKGIIKNTLEIGNLKTIWGVLGEFKSLETHQQEKYFVNQVVNILKHPNNIDNFNACKLLKKISYYKELYEKNKLELIITLKEYKCDYMIVDGNTRVVSCYEYCLEKEIDEVNLSVFIVT